MSLAKRLLSIILIAVLLSATFPLVSTPAPAAAADAWTPMTSGTTETLTAVWGSSCNDVWTVGMNGTILHWDGSTWSSVASGTSMGLQGVWGNSATNVFTVGWSGTILNWNGTAWSAMTSGTDRDLYAVWGNAANSVFAVGGMETILYWDGTTWTTMTTAGREIALRGVWGTAYNNVYAVGNETILHWDGSVWTEVLNDGFEIFAGIWGSSATDIYVSGQSGTIWHWDGSAWSFSILSSAPLAGLWGTSANDIFTVGDSYVVLHYDGSAWDAMTGGSMDNLYGVWGQNSTHVFAVGDAGTIIHYGAGCPPIITSFTPTSGSNSTRVVITGTNFIGVTAVKFGNNRAARFTVSSDTKITAYVGTCETGKVRVTTPAGTAISNATFTCNAQEEQIGTTPKGSWLPGTTSTATPTQSVKQVPVSMPSISIKNASLSATKVAPGTPVTVTADVINTGTANGSSSIQVYVNGEVDTTQGVTVSSGSSTPVTFTVIRNEPGTYTVYVNGASAGSFTVDQFSPDTILIISGTLVFFAFILGIIYVIRRKQV